MRVPEFLLSFYHGLSRKFLEIQGKIWIWTNHVVITCFSQNPGVVVTGARELVLSLLIIDAYVKASPIFLEAK